MFTHILAHTVTEALTADVALLTAVVVLLGTIARYAMKAWRIIATVLQTVGETAAAVEELKKQAADIQVKGSVATRDVKEKLDAEGVA